MGDSTRPASAGHHADRPAKAGVRLGSDRKVERSAAALLDTTSAEDPTPVRLRMLSNGYHPVPVVGIHMDVGSPGKRPAPEFNNWPERCAAADEAEIRRWSAAYPGCVNTGAGCDNLAAFDFDLLNDASADLAEAHTVAVLGPTPLRRIGLAPKRLLVYRTSTPIRSRKTKVLRLPNGTTGRIEILGLGAQFVAHGLHPDTRRPYVWTDGSPLSTPRADLPEVSEEDIEKCLADVLDALLANGCEYVKPAMTVREEAVAPGRAGDVFLLDGGTAYGLKALEDECIAIRDAPFGSQEETINRAGWCIGQLVAGGHLDEAVAKSELLTAACSVPSEPGKKPWILPELERKVLRAIGDGKRQPRSPPLRAEALRHYNPRREGNDGARRVPDAEEAELGTLDHAAVQAELSAQEFVWIEPNLIQPRQWLLGTVLIREYISLLVAVGGAGKTTLGIGAALSVASGRNLLGEHVSERGGAWIFNLEDPLVEMQRRVTAAMMHHGIRPEEVRGRLFVNSGRDRRLVIARMNDIGSARIVYPDKARLVEEARRHGIAGIVVDPFIASHELDENSNEHMNKAACAWAEVAAEANCAVLLIHHMRKGSAAGQAADIEAGRGAKALSDAARVGLTLAPMSEQEAKDFSISIGEKWRYVRLDDAKVNLAPRADRAKWFCLTSVALGNTADPRYPNGDHVQAIERWEPPRPFEGLTDAGVNKCLDQIAAGLIGGDGNPTGRRFGKSRKGGSKRWAGDVVMSVLGKTEAEATKILDTWLQNGSLVERDYHDPQTRKPEPSLFVDDTKRPGWGGAPCG